MSLGRRIVEQMFERDKVETEQAEIPAGLAEMEPGPVLAALLSSLSVSQLTGYQRIVVMRAHQKLASHYQASVYADMASVSEMMNQLDPDPALAWESAAAEIRAALRLTRRAAEAELCLALDLVERLPAVGKWKERPTRGGEREGRCI